MFDKYGYDWKKIQSKDIGFIAQELNFHLPEVVSFKNDNWYVKYDEIVSICIRAIQQQSSFLDFYEKEMDGLENFIK